MASVSNEIYGDDAGDPTVCELHTPRASLRVPRSMSISSGGCFAPETLIQMADGRNKLIFELRRGDNVWTPAGAAMVRALVVCKTAKRAQPMSMLNHLVITPYHPIKFNGVWRFPADVCGYTDRLIQTVYNLVLDRGHIVRADGIEAVTLGHGFTENIVRHEYFGTERVIDDLMKLPGWIDGRPTFNNLTTIRDPTTNIIVGWLEGQTV